jgi:tetratricopeptide (TPR) repeat protein
MEKFNLCYIMESSLNELISLLDQPALLREKVEVLKKNMPNSDEVDGFLTLYSLMNGDTQKIKIYLLETKNKVTQSLPKTRNISIIKYAAIFISVISFGSFFIIKSNSVDYYSKYAEKDPGLPVFMSIDQNKLDNWMLDYKEENFELALKEGIQLEKDYPNNDTINYYLGIIQLELKQPENAVKTFDKVEANKQSIYIEKARFLKCISLLEFDKEKAKAELLKLSKENSFYGRKAKEIINEVF